MPSILKFFLHLGAIAKTLFWCLVSPVQQAPTKRLLLYANQRHLEAYPAIPVKSSSAVSPTQERSADCLCSGIRSEQALVIKKKVNLVG